MNEGTGGFDAAEDARYEIHTRRKGDGNQRVVRHNALTERTLWLLWELMEQVYVGFSNLQVIEDLHTDEVMLEVSTVNGQAYRLDISANSEIATAAELLDFTINK